MFGQNAPSFGLGLLAVLLGLGGIAAAVRGRRRRAAYSEAYAARGGIVFTVVQVGCSTVLLAGGLAIMILAIIFRK
ncbi:MAG TPA: hypothetical protein VGG31_08175 [Candidatus Dormibacteraeota bacterium]|jgi:hypothetical protein